MRGPSSEIRRLDARIRELASARGIVLTHLPQLAGVASSHFWDVMKGRKNPTVRWLSKIAAVLKCETPELLGGGVAGPAPSPKARRYPRVPLVSLGASTRPFTDPEAVESFGEINARTRRALEPGMFALVVSGRSMEPKIRDGSVCLFRVMEGRDPNGKVLLLELRGGRDPETGGRYTVKRFRVAARKQGRITRVRLVPENRKFPPLVLEKDPMRRITALAEFLEVLVPASR